MLVSGAGKLWIARPNMLPFLLVTIISFACSYAFSGSSAHSRLVHMRYLAHHQMICSTHLKHLSRFAVDPGSSIIDTQLYSEVTTPRLMANPRKLITWVEENGGEFNADIVDQQGNWSLVCRGSVQAGETIITVPRQLCIASDPMHGTAQMAHPLLASTQRLMSSLHPTRQWRARLAIALLSERVRPNSFYAPYLRNMPFEFWGLPLFFSSDEFNMLQDASLRESTRSRCSFLSDFTSQVLAPLSRFYSSHGHSSSRSDSNESHDQDPFSGNIADVNAFGWGFACASSRALRNIRTVHATEAGIAPKQSEQGLEGTAHACPVMLPLIDITAHSFSPNCEVVATCDISRHNAADVDGGGTHRSGGSNRRESSGAFGGSGHSQYELRAIRAIADDEPLTICYGPFSNDELLADYGFTVEDNPYDCATVTLDAPLINWARTIMGQSGNGYSATDRDAVTLGTKLFSSLGAEDEAYDIARTASSSDSGCDAGDAGESGKLFHHRSAEPNVVQVGTVRVPVGGVERHSNNAVLAIPNKAAVSRNKIPDDLEGQDRQDGDDRIGGSGSGSVKRRASALFQPVGRGFISVGRGEGQIYDEKWLHGWQELWLSCMNLFGPTARNQVSIGGALSRSKGSGDSGGTSDYSNPARNLKSGVISTSTSTSASASASASASVYRMDPRLVAFLRVLYAPSEASLQVQGLDPWRIQSPGGMLSAAREAHVVRTLIGIVAVTLHNYGTELRQDQADAQLLLLGGLPAGGSEGGRGEGGGGGRASGVRIEREHAAQQQDGMRGVRVEGRRILRDILGLSHTDAVSSPTAKRISTAIENGSKKEAGNRAGVGAVGESKLEVMQGDEVNGSTEEGGGSVRGVSDSFRRVMFSSHRSSNGAVGAATSNFSGGVDYSATVNKEQQDAQDAQDAQDTQDAQEEEKQQQQQEEEVVVDKKQQGQQRGMAYNARELFLHRVRRKQMLAQLVHYLTQVYELLRQESNLTSSSQPLDPLESLEEVLTRPLSKSSGQSLSSRSAQIRQLLDQTSSGRKDSVAPNLFEVATDVSQRWASEDVDM